MAWEIRSMSLSPECQGCSDTDHVRVLLSGSRVASSVWRERDMEPSRVMKSRVWPVMAECGAMVMMTALES